MRIHCRGDSKRPLQPRIVARGKALEREATHLVELVDVVLERLVAEKTASRVAECGGGLPSSSLECRGRPVLECEALIPALDRGHVSQKCTNRVARGIMQMI
jgi:hypothetical protein